LLGDDFFNDVVAADLFADYEMDHLKVLPQLQQLVLDSTEVTDAGLKNLAALPRLQRLLFGGGGHEFTRLGDDNLKSLTLIRTMAPGTKVTDDGLEYLVRLTGLQELLLGGTQITEQSVKKLRQALPNCQIQWEPPTQDWREGRVIQGPPVRVEPDD
jgi:hypothetical protein